MDLGLETHPKKDETLLEALNRLEGLRTKIPPQKHG